MNKILLLFSVAFALVAFSAAFMTPNPAKSGGSFFSPATNSCEQNYDCQKSGKSCSGNFGDLSCNASSANSTCCGMGLFCINQTCVSDTVGDYCHNISDCYGGGAFSACQNNTCVQLGLPGDECSESSDCFYSSSVCNNSLCTGLSTGAKCNPKQYACGAGLYCQTNAKTLKSSCQPQIAANQSCLPGIDICADGNICGFSGKCISPFQGGNGTKCLASAECNTDLYCQNGKCNTWTSWSQTSCTNSSSCSDDEICICDEITGDQFCLPITLQVQSYCAEDAQSALSCLAENNCSYYYAYQSGMVSNLPPDSCPAQNCKSSYKKAQSCGCDASKDIFGNCIYSSYCGGFPVWAIIVIAIVGVILVLVVIVVIVMVMRRRRTYESIA